MTKLILATLEITNEEPIANALTGTARTVRLFPSEEDLCTCGHEYRFHNYSDSLISKTDPLGHMYECNGAGHGDYRECKCLRFFNRRTGELYR